jgi:hypothetical protein
MTKDQIKLQMVVRIKDVDIPGVLTYISPDREICIVYFLKYNGREHVRHMLYPADVIKANTIIER